MLLSLLMDRFTDWQLPTLGIMVSNVGHRAALELGVANEHPSHDESEAPAGLRVPNL